MPGTVASPKSITTGPSGPSRTLAGLKSRCTIPTACTAPSAVSVATAMRSSAEALRGPSCSTASTSDGPLTYSLTMNGRRSKIPASRTCAVQNRATRCAAATSFRPVPDPRVRCRWQDLEGHLGARAADGQEHDALAAFAEATEQPVPAHLLRIGHAQRKHPGNRGPRGRHLTILPWARPGKSTSPNAVKARSRA